MTAWTRCTRRARSGILGPAFVLLAVVMPWHSADGQVRYKQIAAPADRLLAGVHDLPAPERTGVASPSAMIPVQFEVEGDRLVWRSELPIDDGSDVRMMLLAPGAEQWRLSVTPSNGVRQDLHTQARASGLLVESGAALLGDVTHPATAYRLLDRNAGAWRFEVQADPSMARTDGAAGYLLIKTGHAARVYSHLTTHRLLTGSEVGLVSGLIDGSGEPMPGAVREGVAIVRTPAGEELRLRMKAEDGAVSFRFVPEYVGEHTVRVTVRGVHADGSRFVRSSQHVFPVLADELELGARASIVPDRPGTRRVVVALDRTDRAGRVIASAELWGTDKAGAATPVCWLSGMADVDREAGEVSLYLDERWLSVAGARAPFELREVRVQCCDTAVPLAIAESMSIDLAAPLSAPRSGVTVTPDMLTGRPRADLSASPIDNAAARARAFAGHNLMLVHGYCSSGVWPVQDFSGGLEVFLDQNQNRSHDDFALLMAAFGDNSKSFGVVAHSQGGAAALHLWTYYFSGLDWAEGARLIQSVGTPYQGTPLAGNLAVLGDLFGAGCGVNFDLSTDGSALWLAGIPTASRSRVHYWTTSFEDGFGFDFCNLVSDFFLSDPDDGVIERSRGQLPGANNMGHLEGWCHSQGMRDPAHYFDSSRNADMNANAAR